MPKWLYWTFSLKGVPETIVMLKKAGIKVWVLTGKFDFNIWNETNNKIKLI